MFIFIYSLISSFILAGILSWIIAIRYTLIQSSSLNEIESLKLDPNQTDKTNALTSLHNYLFKKNQTLPEKPLSHLFNLLRAQQSKDGLPLLVDERLYVIIASVKEDNVLKMMPKLGDLAQLTRERFQSRIELLLYHVIASTLLICGILGTLWAVSDGLTNQNGAFENLTFLKQALGPSLLSIIFTIILIFGKFFLSRKIEQFYIKLHHITKKYFIPLFEPHTALVSMRMTFNNMVHFDHLKSELNQLADDALTIHQTVDVACNKLFESKITSTLPELHVNLLTLWENITLYNGKLDTYNNNMLYFMKNYKVLLDYQEKLLSSLSHMRHCIESFLAHFESWNQKQHLTTEASTQCLRIAHACTSETLHYYQKMRNTLEESKQEMQKFLSHFNSYYNEQITYKKLFEINLTHIISNSTLILHMLDRINEYTKSITSSAANFEALLPSLAQSIATHEQNYPSFIQKLANHQEYSTSAIKFINSISQGIKLITPRTRKYANTARGFLERIIDYANLITPVQLIIAVIIVLLTIIALVDYFSYLIFGNTAILFMQSNFNFIF